MDTLSKRTEAKKHTLETVKKATILCKSVWRIEERKFNGDDVMMYDTEIHGWKEQEKFERIQRRYTKWTLGLDYCTPDYIVAEETGREKMKTKTDQSYEI